MLARIFIPALIVTGIVHFLMFLLDRELEPVSYAMGTFAMIGIVIGNELMWSDDK
jgi:hypothetical protein